MTESNPGETTDKGWTCRVCWMRVPAGWTHDCGGKVKRSRNVEDTSRLADVAARAQEAETRGARLSLPEDVARLMERLKIRSDTTSRDAFDAIVALAARAQEAETRHAQLLEAIRVVVEDGVPQVEPIERWAQDGTPSKHDKCAHDRFRWEDCGDCIEAWLSAAMKSPARGDD